MLAPLLKGNNFIGAAVKRGKVHGYARNLCDLNSIVRKFFLEAPGYLKSFSNIGAVGYASGKNYFVFMLPGLPELGGKMSGVNLGQVLNGSGGERRVPIFSSLNHGEE